MYALTATVNNSEPLVFICDDNYFLQGLQLYSADYFIDCSPHHSLSVGELQSFVYQNSACRYVLCIANRGLFLTIYRLLYKMNRICLILSDFRRPEDTLLYNQHGLIISKKNSPEVLFTHLIHFAIRTRRYSVGSTPKSEYIIRELCKGRSTLWLAQELGLSSKTIYTMKYNYLRKYNLHSYNDLGLLMLCDLQPPGEHPSWQSTIKAPGSPASAQ